MALINCSECGKQISDAAATCPHCGHPNVARPQHNSPSGSPNNKKKLSWTHWMGMILFVPVFLAVFGSFFSSSDTSENRIATNQQPINNSRSSSATVSLPSPQAVVRCGQDDTVGIETVAPHENRSFCEAIKRGIGDDPPFWLYNQIEKASYLLEKKGSRTSKYLNATSLAEIVKERGHLNAQELGTEDLDTVFKSYNFYNGEISPLEVVKILRTSGPLAKTMDKDGFLNVIVLQVNIWRSQGIAEALK